MRIIGHLDMDAFFASIEERDNPRLRGLPIVVGGDPEGGRGRGVVSTANYRAREYGIRSALPIATAWRYSEAARKKGLPPAVFLEVDMEKYVAISANVMGILREVLGAEAGAPGHGALGDRALVEEASVDEAYFDLSFLAESGALPEGASTNSYDAAIKVAERIKAEIKTRERLTASVGIGPNKLIAKIASDRQKPDGLTVVRGDVPHAVEKFLEPLTIRTIPGVGPKTEERFKTLGVRTVRDALRFTEVELHEMFGKWGIDLHKKLRGRDEAPLETRWVPKSVGEQETFPRDTHDQKFLRERLAALATGVYERFVGESTASVAGGGGFTSFRGVTITVRFADFKTVTRSATLDTPVPAVDPTTPASRAALQTLQFQVWRLFMPFLDRRENPDKKAFRLLGVRVERLE